MTYEGNQVIVISDDDDDDNHGRDDNNNMASTDDDRIACREQVMAILPDFCPHYLKSLLRNPAFDALLLFANLLDQLAHGIAYPKNQRYSHTRKRTAAEENDVIDKLAKTFDNPARRAEQKDKTYLDEAGSLLRQAFPHLHVKDILNILKSNGNCLFPTYLELAGDVGKGLTRKKTNTRRLAGFRRHEIDRTIEKETHPSRKIALIEFKAAQSLVAAREARLKAEEQRQREGSDNRNQAKAHGMPAVCEYCCGEFARNRMVHCSAETPHWFCRGCTRQMAQIQVDLSKYELGCMSTTGCTGTFSSDQRRIFLDEKLRTALERLEQEAKSRPAGIENLETCPFCPFAAGYPSVEVDQEFRCQEPGCKVVSCRLCRQETHIPRSCEEARLENERLAQRAFGKVMPDLMIPRCNKCNNPFIKQSGSNKMMCTGNGCINVRCYVCGQSCLGYDHFDDVPRGGRTGNCPLFDSVEHRHGQETAPSHLGRNPGDLQDMPYIQHGPPELGQIQVPPQGAHACIPPPFDQMQVFPGQHGAGRVVAPGHLMPPVVVPPQQQALDRAEDSSIVAPYSGFGNEYSGQAYLIPPVTVPEQQPLDRAEDNNIVAPHGGFGNEYSGQAYLMPPVTFPEQQALDRAEDNNIVAPHGGFVNEYSGQAYLNPAHQQQRLRHQLEEIPSHVHAPVAVQGQYPGLEDRVAPLAQYQVQPPALIPPQFQAHHLQDELEYQQSWDQV